MSRYDAVSTSKERSDLPDSDSGSSMKLTKDEFHEEQWKGAEEQHQEVWNEKRSYNNVEFLKQCN